MEVSLKKSINQYFCYLGHRESGTDESKDACKEPSLINMKTISPLVEISCYVNLAELRKSSKYKQKIFLNAIYEGEMCDDNCWGKGIIQYNSGRRYEGSWVSNKRHGKGFERFESGNTYEGDYLDGYPNGKGIYTWKNGEIYDGEWVMAKKHGNGMWRGTQGDSYIGEWKNNKSDGYGVHYWRNGKIEHK